MLLGLAMKIHIHNKTEYHFHQKCYCGSFGGGEDAED